MLESDVVDELHDEHGLAHACTAEKADLSTTGVGSKQVHHFDSGFEHLDTGGLVGEGGGLAVNGAGAFGLDGTQLVNGCADHIHDSAQNALAHWHCNRLASVGGRLPTGETVGGLHGDAADGVFAKMLRHLNRQVVSAVINEELVRVKAA